MTDGTRYTAEVETPNGIVVHVETYVPEDAEYPDQHEQAEAVGTLAGRIVAAIDRSRNPEMPF